MVSLMSFGRSFLDLLRSVHLVISPLRPRNIHLHLNHFRCYITGFLHHCIYTPQHIPGDGSFYFACVPSQSLTLLLHCNTCPMEHLGHGNSVQSVISAFSAYHACIYLLIL